MTEQLGRALHVTTTEPAVVILSSQAALVQQPEPERAAVDVPNSIRDLFRADICCPPSAIRATSRSMAGSCSRLSHLPDPAQTAAMWRERAAAAGLPGLYLVRVESFRSDVAWVSSDGRRGRLRRPPCL
jgi:hypothetical protein